MAHKEIRIPMDEIQNPQTITGINRRKFAEHGSDYHIDEVREIVDDYDKGIRIIKVETKRHYRR